MRFRRPAIEVIVVQVLLAVYGAFFIHRTSFIVDGARHFALNDQAMTAMRCARDLASGEGWSWGAIGSSPLWMPWMTLLHRLPLTRPTISVAVQIAALVWLLVNLGFVHAIALRVTGSRRVAFIALVVTAAFYPFDNAALQGMEAGLLAVWMSCGAWFVLRAWPRMRRLLQVGVVSIATVTVLFQIDFTGTASWKCWTLIARPPGVTENRRRIQLARRLENITTERAIVFATSPGCLGYFIDRNCVDAGSAGITQPDVFVESSNRRSSPARYHGYDLGVHGTILLRRDSNEIVLDPSDRIANQLWWDGLALQNQGRIDEALEHFERAIAMGQPNDTWPYSFGALLVERRSLAEVESYYDRIAALDRKPHISEYCRGVALARAGKFDQAVDRFNRALAIDPAHEASYEMIGNVLATQSRFDAAIEAYRVALDIVPEYASAHRNLATALQRLGRDAEAQLHLRRAAEGDPSSAQRCYYWGRFLLEHGHASLAIAPLEYALAADPDHAAARRLLQRAQQTK